MQVSPDWSVEPVIFVTVVYFVYHLILRVKASNSVKSRHFHLNIKVPLEYTGQVGLVNKAPVPVPFHHNPRNLKVVPIRRPTCHSQGQN